MIARYDITIRPFNQAGSRGTPVTVYAATAKEARRRAIALGWSFDPKQARATIDRVVEVESTEQQEADQ